nr:uncharacterized protein LOC127328947 [Lolium perenne]
MGIGTVHKFLSWFPPADRALTTPEFRAPCSLAAGDSRRRIACAGSLQLVPAGGSRARTTPEFRAPCSPGSGGLPPADRAVPTSAGNSAPRAARCRRNSAPPPEIHAPRSLAPAESRAPRSPTPAEPRAPRSLAPAEPARLAALAPAESLAPRRLVPAESRTPRWLEPTGHPVELTGPRRRARDLPPFASATSRRLAPLDLEEWRWKTLVEWRRTILLSKTNC